MFPGLKPESNGIGFLGQAPMLPAISSVPINWLIVQRMSGNKYNVGRQIEIQFYADGRTNEEAQKKLIQYIDAFIEILVNDEGFFFHDKRGKKLVYSFDYQSARFENTSATLRGFKVRQASVPLVLFSRGYRPTQAPKTTKIVKSSDKDVFESIFSKIVRNVRSGRLRGIKEVSRNPEIPKGGGLAITCHLENLTNERHASGEDLFDFAVQCTVWSKLLPGLESLVNNIQRAELIKDILDEDETFGGRLWNSFVQSIEFNSENSEKSWFYATRINFVGRKHRSTQFGNN